MRFFLAHWKRYTRWTSLIFVAITIIGTIMFWRFTLDSIGLYGDQTIPIIIGGNYQYIIYLYFIFFLILSITLEIGNVFSTPIKRDRMIQEVTKKYSRNKIFFIKSSYLFLSIWWKIILIGILCSLGIAIGANFNSARAGDLYHFLWASIGALFFLSSGLIVIIMLISLYISSISVQVLGWIIFLGFGVYLLIMALSAASVLPLGTFPTYPTNDINNPVFPNFERIPPQEWTNSQNAFLGTAWFNIPYQFTLIQYYFWGIAFANPFQLQGSFNMRLGILTLPKNYTFSGSDNGGISGIFNGNLYTPLAVFMAWLLIPTFVYGMSYKAFQRKDFS